MSGHTPGPWRIEGSRGAGLIISAGTNAECDGPDSYVGVLDPMFYIAGQDTPFRADAQLICAVPDMVAALKSVQAWIKHWAADVECGLKPSASSLEAAKREIDAAIAKAPPPSMGGA